MDQIESLTMYTEMYIRRETAEGVTNLVENPSMVSIDPRAQQIEEAIKKLLARGTFS